MRDKKRFSMRGKMIRANIGIILAALVLCGSIFVISVFLIVGEYIRTDINFFLTVTADNLEAKLEYCENVIYSLRGEEEILGYLGRAGDRRRTDENEEARRSAEEAFEEAADISASANLSTGNTPIVEEIYLFDRNGNMLSTSYYAMISAEKEKSREIMKGIYKEFETRFDEKNSYAFYVREEFVYLAFPLLDDNMFNVGSVIYKISKKALFDMMSDTGNYEKSFWVLYDLAGGYIAGEGTEKFNNQNEEILNEFHNKPYKQEISGRDYRIYRKFICMDMQVIIGVPENQTMLLMYDSAKIYMFLIAVITAMGCLLSFFMIYRLTKPIEEITDKLQEVKEGDFESKLPEYDSREFNEISETFNDMTTYINHLIKQVYEKQISIKDMELKFLQTQMNPHFMFNVLNTIALQAKMDNNEEVYKMISTFSQLIQAKIYRSGKEKVQIGQELKYVEYYLYLQRYRFGEHLKYHIEIENEALKELYIPKLCIQLIVENAVVHGIEPKVEGGNVSVRVYEESGNVRIDTEDDGVGFETGGIISLPLEMKESDKNHNHVGLNNAHNIIRMMYGEDYGIRIISERGQGTKISICIPFDEGSKRGNENDESYAG